MAADDDFFNGQELDEFLEELKRRGMLDIPPKKTRPKTARHPEGLPTVHVQPGVGKFMFPAENSWSAHRQLIEDPQLGLKYWPSHQPYFDNMVHQRVDLDPLWNDHNSAFAAYDVLRENLAIVRNYIMCEFFPDGSAEDDKTDLQKVNHLAQIGQLLADGLNNDRLIPNPLEPVIRADQANLPATGAQYIYSQIVKRQNYQSWLDPILHPVAWLTGKTAVSWDLPPVEDSPFSDAALRLPPPAPHDDTLTDDDVGLIADAMDKAGIMAPQNALNFSEELNEAATDITAARAQYANVAHLQEPTKRESVEIAKDILNKLKLKLGEALIENGLTAFARENFSVMDALKGAVRVYEFHLHKLMQTDPTIMNNPAIVAANKAIGTLGYIAKQDVLKSAEKSGNKDLADSVRKEISRMPQSWKSSPDKTLGQLLGKLEAGFNTVLLRLTQTAHKNSGPQYWMGFSNETSMSRPDPSQGHDDGSQKAMADNAYYQQLNARKAVQQHRASMMSHNFNQKRQDQSDDHLPSGPSTATHKPTTTTQNVPAHPIPANASAPAKPSINQLVGKDQMRKMRKLMATDANADAVEINRRQQILRQETERRQARSQQKAALQATKHVEQAKAAEHDEPKAAHTKSEEKPNQKPSGMHKSHSMKISAPKVHPPTPNDEQKPTIKAPTHNPNKRDPSRGM